MTLSRNADNRTSLLISTGLVALAFVVFGRILGHGFVWWDDADEIFANPAFLPPTFASIAEYWTGRPDETHYFKPVTQTAWGIVAAVAYDPGTKSLAAAPFHGASILVHGLASVVVLRLLRRILTCGFAAASIGATLFLLHPIQTEAVAWASGLKDLLCASFTLLAILVWLKATDPDTRSRRDVHYTLATVCFILAMLSKPAGVVTPLLAGAAEWYAHRTVLRRLFMRLFPWLLLSLVMALVTKILMPAAVVDRPPFWARPLVAGDALAFYLYKLVVPWSLAPDYGRRPAAILNHWWAYVAWAVPAAVAGVCAIAWRKGALAPALGLALFVLSLLPVLGFVPTEFQYYSTVADHYTYVAMLGVAILAAAIAERSGHRVRIAAVLLLILNAGLSIRQAGFWRNDVALFEHTVKVNPNSFAGYAQLGFAHLRAARPEEGAAAYREAIRINPDHPNGHDIWIYYSRKGDLDAAVREIGAYIVAAGKSPLVKKQVLPTLHLYRGQMLRDLGRREDAARDFRRALELDPALDAARAELSRL